MSAGQRADMDRRLLEHVKECFDWAKFGSVMVFLPIERQHEVNTWPLVRWIWEKWPELEVYVPRMAAGELKAVQIGSETTFEENDWGVPEPVGGTALKADEALDLVITPLLGFDLAGNRVGYGGGYYDRFLAVHSSARRIGLGYESFRVGEGVAAEAHDAALQAVITEERIHTF